MITPCPRCQRPPDEGDRFCRHCGQRLGTPEFGQDLHHTMVESVPVGLFTVDASSRVRYWNRAMEEQTGVRRRDALGRVLFEVVTCLQPYTHRITHVLDTGTTLRLDQVTHGAEQGAEQTRSFCFIDDCIAGIYRLMQSDHAEPLNLGQDRLVTINQLADMVAAAAGVRIAKRHVPGPQGVRGRNSDNTRLREVLGWEPEVTLEDGLARTYEWVERQVRARQAVAGAPDLPALRTAAVV